MPHRRYPSSPLSTLRAARWPPSAEYLRIPTCQEPVPRPPHLAVPLLSPFQAPAGGAADPGHYLICRRWRGGGKVPALVPARLHTGTSAAPKRPAAFAATPRPGTPASPLRVAQAVRRPPATLAERPQRCSSEQPSTVPPLPRFQRHLQRGPRPGPVRDSVASTGSGGPSQRLDTAGCQRAQDAMRASSRR